VNLRIKNMSNDEKTLDVENVEDAKTKVSDIKVVGNGDMFSLLCKASSQSQGWMKSAKAMATPSGCVVQVTTQQGDNVAEALTFVPNVMIVDDINGGKKLVDFPNDVPVCEECSSDDIDKFYRLNGVDGISTRKLLKDLHGLSDEEILKHEEWLKRDAKLQWELDTIRSVGS